MYKAQRQDSFARFGGDAGIAASVRETRSLRPDDFVQAFSRDTTCDGPVACQRVEQPLSRGTSDAVFADRSEPDAPWVLRHGVLHIVKGELYIYVPRSSPDYSLTSRRVASFGSDGGGGSSGPSPQSLHYGVLETCLPLTSIRTMRHGGAMGPPVLGPAAPERFAIGPSGAAEGGPRIAPLGGSGLAAAAAAGDSSPEGQRHSGWGDEYEFVFKYVSPGVGRMKDVVPSGSAPPCADADSDAAAIVAGVRGAVGTPSADTRTLVTLRLRVRGATARREWVLALHKAINLVTMRAIDLAQKASTTRQPGGGAPAPVDALAAALAAAQLGAGQQQQPTPSFPPQYQPQQQSQGGGEGRSDLAFGVDGGANGASASLYYSPAAGDGTAAPGGGIGSLLTQQQQGGSLLLSRQGALPPAGALDSRVSISRRGLHASSVLQPLGSYGAAPGGGSSGGAGILGQRTGALFSGGSKSPQVGSPFLAGNSSPADAALRGRSGSSGAFGGDLHQQEGDPPSSSQASASAAAAAMALRLGGARAPSSGGGSELIFSREEVVFSASAASTPTHSGSASSSHMAAAAAAAVHVHPPTAPIALSGRGGAGAAAPLAPSSGSSPFNISASMPHRSFLTGAVSGGLSRTSLTFGARMAPPALPASAPFSAAGAAAPLRADMPPAAPGLLQPQQSFHGGSVFGAAVPAEASFAAAPYSACGGGGRAATGTSAGSSPTLLPRGGAGALPRSGSGGASGSFIVGVEAGRVDEEEGEDDDSDEDDDEEEGASGLEELGLSGTDSASGSGEGGSGPPSHGAGSPNHGRRGSGPGAGNATDSGSASSSSEGPRARHGNGIRSDGHGGDGDDDVFGLMDDLVPSSSSATQVPVQPPRGGRSSQRREQRGGALGAVDGVPGEGGSLARGSKPHGSSSRRAAAASAADTGALSAGDQRLQRRRKKRGRTAGVVVALGEAAPPPGVPVSLHGGVVLPQHQQHLQQQGPFGPAPGAPITSAELQLAEMHQLAFTGQLQGQGHQGQACPPSLVATASLRTSSSATYAAASPVGSEAPLHHPPFPSPPGASLLVSRSSATVSLTASAAIGEPTAIAALQAGTGPVGLGAVAGPSGLGLAARVGVLSRASTDTAASAVSGGSGSGSTASSTAYVPRFRRRQMEAEARGAVADASGAALPPGEEDTAAAAAGTAGMAPRAPVDSSHNSSSSAPRPLSLPAVANHRSGAACPTDWSGGSYSSAPAPGPPSGENASATSAGNERSGGHGTPSYGVWAAIGARARQEDAHSLISDVEAEARALASSPALPHPTAASANGHPHTNGSASAAAAPSSSFAAPPTALFAVYDGHGGRAAADFTAARLTPLLAAHPSFPHDLPTALRECFLAVDAEYLAAGDRSAAGDPRGQRSPHFNAGSTALVAVLRGLELTTASLGDSRALIVKIRGPGPGAGEHTLASVLHSPELERGRIEAAGGWVASESEFSLGVLECVDLTDSAVVTRVKRWTQISRVNGDLAVSRAIGDPDFKGAARMAAHTWHRPPGVANRPFSGDLVLSSPDVLRFTLTAGEDALLLLACDGLWEVLSNEEAAALALQLLRPRAEGGDGLSPRDAARRLVERALYLGSSDNVTAVVVLLPTAPPGLRREQPAAPQQ